MTRRRSPPKSSGRAASAPAESGLSEDAFWKKLSKLPARASSRLIHQALILYCVLTDRSTPAWVRGLIVATLVYLINPFDAVPDALPGIGLADDAAAIALLLQRLAAYVTPTIEARASRLVPWGDKAADAGPADNTNSTKTTRKKRGTQREDQSQDEGQ